MQGIGCIETTADIDSLNVIPRLVLGFFVIVLQYKDINNIILIFLKILKVVLNERFEGY